MAKITKEEKLERYKDNLVDMALLIHDAAEDVHADTDLPFDQCIELVKTAELSLAFTDICDHLSMM